MQFVVSTRTRTDKLYMLNQLYCTIHYITLYTNIYYTILLRIHRAILQYFNIRFGTIDIMQHIILEITHGIRKIRISDKKVAYYTVLCST